MSGSPLASRRFFRNPLGYSRARPDERPLLGIRAGLTRQFLIRDPECIWKVLVTEGEAFRPGRWKRRLSRFTGPSLNTLHGDEHRRRRELLQPSYSRARIERLSPLIARRAAVARDVLREGDRIELRGLIDQLSLSMVGDVLLGVDLAEEAEEMVPEIKTVVASAARFTPPLRLTAQGRVKRSLERRIDAWIEAREQEPRRRGEDLLSVLLASDLDRETVRGEIISVLHPAVDEPTSALEAIWWFLGRNPDADRALSEELSRLPAEGPLQLEEVENLQWQRAISNEALRLLPPSRYVDRCPVTDRTVLAGRSLRRDSNLLISPLVTHRDPTLFASPDEFRPQRMISGGPSGPGPKGSFIPFGAGTHTCIGQVLARAIIDLTLASIARKWRLRLDPGVPSPSPRTGGFVFTVEPREPQGV